MVSYLNAHDALEQRRRAAKEAGTSGRAGPRTIVSAVARLCTCARPLASILCGWRSCDRASISGAWHCRSAILIKVTSAEKAVRCKTSLNTRTAMPWLSRRWSFGCNQWQKAEAWPCLAGCGPNRCGQEQPVQDPAKLCGENWLGAHCSGSRHRCAAPVKRQRFLTHCMTCTMPEKSVSATSVHVMQIRLQSVQKSMLPRARTSGLISANSDLL